MTSQNQEIDVEAIKENIRQFKIHSKRFDKTMEEIWAGLR
jgi:hypothetical protein